MCESCDSVFEKNISENKSADPKTDAEDYHEASNITQEEIKVKGKLELEFPHFF